MPAGLNHLSRALSLAVHELRTPMTVTAGYLRMLLRDQAGPLNEKQRKMVAEADRSCTRVNALVAELSELGKLEAGEIQVPPVRFDLRDVLTELAGSVHTDEDRGVHLDVRAPESVMVTGDRTRVAAALKALMHAAMRERADPGAIVVECATLSDSKQAWAVVAVGDEAAVPSLVDGARGTPPPFDEWRGGLGLALPVGRRVIEAHGGALWSALEPRHGSALRLPLAKN